MSLAFVIVMIFGAAFLREALIETSINQDNPSPGDIGVMNYGMLNNVAKFAGAPLVICGLVIISP